MVAKGIAAALRAVGGDNGAVVPSNQAAAIGGQSTAGGIGPRDATGVIVLTDQATTAASAIVPARASVVAGRIRCGDGPEVAAD